MSMLDAGRTVAGECGASPVEAGSVNGRARRMLPAVALSLAALSVGALGPTALAQRYTLEIEDVPLTIVDADGSARTIDLGDVSVTLSNRGGSGMSAVFRVDESHRPGHGGEAIWEHLELHWINIIRDDDCPATVRGVPAGRAALPFPIIDMPRNGWDYVYKSRRASRGRGPERLESNADGREMRDDARDIWPWYHTPEEEAMRDDSGNGGGGFGQFRQGVVYGIRDLPSLCAGGGLTAFTSLLVGVVPTGQDGDGRGSLQQGQVLVLAGFDWDWTTNGLRLAQTEFTGEDLDRALHNAEFPEWMAAADVAVFAGVGESESGLDEATESEEADQTGEQVAPARSGGLGSKPKAGRWF